MSPSQRAPVRKGSWRWSARVAELAAWGTTVLVAVALHLTDLPRGTYYLGLGLVVGLGLWLIAFFRIFLDKAPDRAWLRWTGVAVNLVFASIFYALLREHVPSAQLVFVPVILGTGLIADLWAALLSAGIATATYWGVAAADGNAPRPLAGIFTAGLFLLGGAVAGLLARELRTHYRGEQEEHRLATAVRHRLMAVVDAVDEGIVFADRQGIVRVVNERVGDIFEIDPEAFLGSPKVELLRTIAKKTEDPEGFMEIFQPTRDEVDIELRHEVEQIIPTRRQLQLYSGPTHDDAGGLVGRIDVYTDVTEARVRSAEAERLYEEARKTAEDYQRALLPDSTPALPRIGIVGHYLPAAGRRAVCGDFYDFVNLGDGRMAMVLGDVCGVGPTAAGDAALCRFTLRSFATDTSDAAALMDRMNAQVTGHMPAERFVRMFIGNLDPERAILEYANAGHVPPVIFRAATGEVEWLGEGGLALGIERESTYKVARVELEPGDMVVLYTDGVTEAPRNGRPFGQGKFLDLVRDYGMGTPGELVQAIRRSVDLWASEGGLRDDIALLVFQVVPDALAGDVVRELVVPNEIGRVPDVRRFVGDFLADARASVEASSEILLAVGEAAANASRHGRNPTGRSEVRVRCALEGSTVSVVIADDGTGFDPEAVDARSPDPFASGGRGLFLMRALMDEVEMHSSSSGTRIVMSRRLT
jgi:serine phosphatase RsbU (regulator of sigma subunit)/anti-sigma regulatory factor (Ser/Thr protein kinase)